MPRRFGVRRRCTAEGAAAGSNGRRTAVPWLAGVHGAMERAASHPGQCHAAAADRCGSRVPFCRTPFPAEAVWCFVVLLVIDMLMLHSAALLSLLAATACNFIHHKVMQQKTIPFCIVHLLIAKLARMRGMQQMTPWTVNVVAVGIPMSLKVLNS